MVVTTSPVVLGLIKQERAPADGQHHNDCQDNVIRAHGAMLPDPFATRVIAALNAGERDRLRELVAWVRACGHMNLYVLRGYLYPADRRNEGEAATCQPRF